MSAVHKLVGIDGQGEATEYPDSVAIPSREDVLLDELAELRGKYNALKAENTKLRKVDPDHEAIMERMERWQTKCHPKAKIPADGKRWKVVKARLSDGYTPEELDAVIDIAAALPFEAYGRRFAEDAPGRTRRDDLTFLFADETRVDRMLAMGPDPEHAAYRRFVHQACQEVPEVRSVLSLLAAREPHGNVLAAAARWARSQIVAPTPIQEGRLL